MSSLIGSWPMYAVVRRRAGAAELADALVKHQDEVTALLKGVAGFKACYALRTSEGVVAATTVCDDRAGTRESSRRAAE